MSILAKAVDGIVSTVRTRADGWINAITGLGGAGDKRTATRWQPTAPLDHATLEGLYSGNDLAALICEAIVEDGLRQGYVIDEDDGRLIDALTKWKVPQLVADGAIFGRAFGSGAILVGTTGEDLRTPLRLPLRPGQLAYLEALDRTSYEPVEWVADQQSPDYGRPTVYQIHESGQGYAVARVGVQVHRSRMILFPGARTTPRMRRQNAGFDVSVMQRIYPILRDYDGTWASIGNLMASLSQAVYKVQGLIQMIAEGQSEQLVTRMELVDIARSVARAIIVDAELEDFQQVGAANVTGAGEVIDRHSVRLAAAARMPVTRLFGQSPAGLNATGESDIRLWYDTVAWYREMVIEPRLVELARMVAQSEGLDDDIAITWPSLWQMSPTEESAHRKTVAEADAIEIASGVLDPAIVTVARYGRGEWSAETASVVAEVIDDVKAQIGRPPELSTTEEE